MYPTPIITLAKKIVKSARNKNITISTAESCTGGLIIGALTEVSGSSSVVDRGFITYTNESKMEMLGVKKETLNNYGAVSEQTVKEMSDGARLHANTSLAVSVSGIAGPSGGSVEKPVGLVHWSLSTETETITGSKIFDGNRESVRLQTVETVLNLILNNIEK